MMVYQYHPGLTGWLLARAVKSAQFCIWYPRLDTESNIIYNEIIGRHSLHLKTSDYRKQINELK